jgi:hypothetical protein
MISFNCSNVVLVVDLVHQELDVEVGRRHALGRQACPRRRPRRRRPLAAGRERSVAVDRSPLPSCSFRHRQGPAALGVLRAPLPRRQMLRIAFVYTDFAASTETSASTSRSRCLLGGVRLRVRKRCDAGRLPHIAPRRVPAEAAREGEKDEAEYHRADDQDAVDPARRAERVRLESSQLVSRLARGKRHELAGNAQLLCRGKRHRARRALPGTLRRASATAALLRGRLLRCRVRDGARLGRRRKGRRPVRGFIVCLLPAPLSTFTTTFLPRRNTAPRRSSRCSNPAALTPPRST